MNSCLRNIIVVCTKFKWDDLSNVQLEASSEWDINYLVNNIKSESSHPWHSQNLKSKNEWIKFVFNETTSVSGLRFKQDDSWSKYGFKNFRFQYSNDNGGVWITFYEGQATNIACCEWEKIEFRSTKKSKHFRLFLIDSWGEHLSIARLQLAICLGNCIITLQIGLCPKIT